MTAPTIYHNATVFTGRADAPLADAFAVRDGRFAAVGSREAVVRALDPGAEQVDLDGRFVMPGFVESHVHLTMLGEALDKVPLRDCDSLDQILERLAAARQSEPAAEQILGAGWRFDVFSDGERPTAAALDAVIADVPVILDANDLHSVWANTAGLEAMGITRSTPDPIGGEIVRDRNGDATGFLLETAAITHAWGYVESVSTEADRDRFLDGAFRAYVESGVTSATDMSFNDADLAAFQRRLDRDGRLPIPVDAHWLLTPSGDVEIDRSEIARVARIRDEIDLRYGSRWLRIIGVKFILDGVIDACTAAMRTPFANGALPSPIWDREFALPAAIAADAAGLQLALHAIGDEASTIALDMVAACAEVNGARDDRRARVEHLEYVGEDTIARMAAYRVTASMQPVHCDPAVLGNWKAMLGDERAEAGFPWRRLREASVPIVLGTDAPTAPHHALRNLYVALTARSALDTTREAYHPERVFRPADALEAQTFGGARAAHRETELGRIAENHRASFCVLDANPLAHEPERLMQARVLQTFVDGVRAHILHEAGPGIP